MTIFQTREEKKKKKRKRKAKCLMDYISLAVELNYDDSNHFNL
jgi:hypothetical protein